MSDVVIAGGGVAGCSLAIMLGRAGVSVELFERGRYPREKPCGEGIMPPGVAALERLGLGQMAGGAPFRGVRYYAGGKMAEAGFPSAGGTALRGRGQRRFHLDRVLFEAAAATPGVVAVSGRAVEAPIVEDCVVRGVVADGRVVRAPLVVVADGLHSPLRRELGLDGPRVRRVRTGVRAHFRLAAGQSQPPWVEVFLGRGYELYVTPLEQGEILVAGLAERGVLKAGVAASFDRWLAEQPILARRLGGSRRLTPYLGRSPLAASVRQGIAPGAVLIGDAAGFVDPITGGGISQALLVSELLAGYVPQILSGEEDAIFRFDRARRALLRDYLLLTRLVLGLARHHTVAVWSVQLMAACPPLFSHLLGVSAGTRGLLPSFLSPPAAEEARARAG